uniref:F-box domain-containing protein n=1 Tax=Salix viminalis TaxID=40686 RepID=A0A6N2ND20_SALVM
MTDYLLEVVMEEILLRLPIESLIKCTSVCMSWYSLVKSTTFISIRSISLDKDDPFYLTSHLLKRGRRTLLSLEPTWTKIDNSPQRQLLVDLVLRGKQLTLLVPLWKVWCYLTKQMQQVMEMIQMLWNSDTD